MANPITTGPMPARDAELVIVALQPNIISVVDLQAMFTTATTELTNAKDHTKRKTQSAVVRVEVPNETEAIPLSISPFMHYATFLRITYWDTYKTDFPDNAFPTEAGLGGQKEPKSKRRDQLINIVDSRRIVKIYGDKVKLPKRKPGQRQAMGDVGAPDIAKAFGWPSGSKAEWLHRSAFLWGGIRGETGPEDVDPNTSQVEDNLIFGSEECNDVMARYEQAWMDLFMRESRLRNRHPLEEGEAYLTGRLLSDTRPQIAYTSSRESPFRIPLTEAQQAQRKTDEEKWPWLCYAMYYQLELSTTEPPGRADPASVILGEVSLMHQEFFPFQRRFSTALERKVDTMILDHLEKRYNTPGPLLSPFPETPMMMMMSLPTGNESMVFHRPTPRADAHDQLWRDMFTGRGSIHVDSITLGRPRFVMGNGHGKVEDVPPAMVGKGPDGQAVLLNTGIDRQNTHRESDHAAHIPTAPPEFVVKGDITIFDKLTATLSTIQKQSGVGVSQRVELTGDLSLGKLIPELVGTPLDSISLKNTSFTYRSTFLGRSPPGVRFYTDIIPTGELMQPVYDVLHEVFGQRDPDLTFAGFIGQEPPWEKPFRPIGFSLRACLQKLNIDLWDVINVTDLGLSLTFSRQIALSPGDASSGYSLSTSFSGSAGVRIPGSVVPLRVSWYLKKFAKYYLLSLNMQDDAWTDAFGIANLKLANVEFDVSFVAGELAKSLTLGIQATLQLQQQSIMLSGSYSKSDWSVEGDLHNVNLQLLQDIYSDLFKKPLATVPDHHNIVFTSLRLRIGTGSFVFEGAVSVDKYTSASAVVTLSSLGLEIKGAVENVHIPVAHGPTITIDSAAIDVFIGPHEESGRAYRIALSGKITEGALQFSVGVYFNHTPGNESQYTVYGTVLNGDLKLSSIEPRVKYTFLDIELTNVAIIISNQQEQWDQVPNTFKYKVKEGFQICATVQKLDAVKKLTKPSGGMGLILSAAYTGTELDVGIEWPTPGTISFNRNIKSGPFSLELVISDNPSIALKAALLIQVPKRAEPLELDFVLTAGAIQATGQASMKDTWNDPFNLNPKVSIGDLLFGVTIIYEEFFVSGIPEAITFGGDLAVGEVKADLLIDVSENPDDELISFHLEKLDLSNLIEYASKFVDAPIPAPTAHDILTIEEFDLYMSTGVTVNKRNYPAGVQFDCKMVVFDHHADISAKIAEATGITIKGSVDSFSLGELTVKGFHSKHADIDIEMTPTVQKIKINGLVSAFGITTALNVDIEIGGDPVFVFDMEVKFWDKLSFKLNAQMIGKLSGKGTKGLDFKFSAEFEQDLLDHIVNEGKNYFRRLNEASKKDYRVASEKLRKSEDGYKKELTMASLKLKRDKQAWDEKRKKQNMAFATGKAEADAKVDTARKWLKQKQAELDIAIKNAEKSIEQAKQKLAVDIKKAQDDIAIGAKHAEEEIDGWRRDVTKKEQELAVIAGNFNASMDAAKNAVTSAKDRVDEIDGEINAKESEISDAHWWSVPGLEIEKVALDGEKDVGDAALWVANKALSVAQAIVDDAVFKTAQAALQLAKDALQDGIEATVTAAKKLEDALQKVKQLGNSTLDAAKDALKLVQTSGLEQLAFDGAQKSLDLAQKVADGSIKALQATVNGLEKSAEFLLFTASSDALDLIKKHIKDLDPERLVVDAKYTAEFAIEGLAKDIVEGIETLLAVKSVNISGELSSGLKEESLKAEIVVVIDKKTTTYNFDFHLADSGSLLSTLWAAVWNDLKKL